MDARKWTIETSYDWEHPDQADSVVLVCSSCASVGTTEITGRTLADIIDLASAHDHVIHRK